MLTTSSLLVLGMALLAGAVLAGIARRRSSRATRDSTEEFSRAMHALTPQPPTMQRVRHRRGHGHANASRSQTTATRRRGSGGSGGSG